MTMDENEKADGKAGEAMQLAANLARIEDLSARLGAAFSQKKEIRASLQGPGPDLWSRTMGAWMNALAGDPAKLMNSQMEFWSDLLRHALEDAEEDATSDMLNLPVHTVVRAQHKAAQDAMKRALADLKGLGNKDHARVSFFANQMLELMAPRNFLVTNPEAMRRAVETKGQSLIDGLENMVNDLEAHQGELLPTLADPNAFQIGGNLATTPGAVVFRNRMMEIIQYKACTDTVHSTPMVLFPPWINKFYILDMKAKNSLVKWICEQGYTLFVVSWVNPDASYRDVGIDTYIQEGFLTAIDQVKKLCGVKKVNVTGYCIGGTTLSLTLALMAKRGDSSVKSATFFTTLSDFSDPGEVGVFLDDDFVDGIEAECQEVGYLDRLFMARTFSYLRARDLVYAPAVRNYLMGEAPPAFDLLFWNDDGTNLPGRMATEYLRYLCQKNVFAGTGFALMGENLHLSDITVPLCSIACETDHIAPWKSVYKGALRMGSQDKSFILSESGHIAGIVNPPSKKKYGHYTNDAWVATPEEWQAGARFTEGSWWERWGKWLSKHSGKKVKARPLGCRNPEQILGPAPGEYVTQVPARASGK